MSEIKVNKISPRSGTDITLGDSGDNFIIPSGATLTNNGTASGFASIAWQSVQTTGFTAVAGNGYFCNTTSAGFTVTLPATPSAGDQIQLVDYAATFDTNILTISPNGNKIEGGTANLTLQGEREGIILTYIDSTQGWIATSGINEGTDALKPEPYSVDFLVIAGGGGGGRDRGGGGGAGGYRNSYSTESSGGGGSSETSLGFNAGTVYTITVGAGGAGAVSPTTSAGANGTDSSISGSDITTITSLGGGGGATSSPISGSSGGSGGGGTINPTTGGTGGAGTANQGYAGGDGAGIPHPSDNWCGGGGGAGEAGNTDGETQGGDGLSSSITGSAVTRGGGGGGEFDFPPGWPSAYSNGGDGGGGRGGGEGYESLAGTANTGGGGGGGSGGGGAPNTDGDNGGSGVVILRMATADYSGTTTGSPTVSTDGSDTILVFNSSGSYTG